MDILVSTKSDLKKAKKDAECVNRLIKRGINPFDVFLELMQIHKRKQITVGKEL